jgi:hypothetical protein
MPPEKDTYVELKRLVTDTEYFISVFKRLEKVISVIFYVLSHRDDSKNDLEMVSYLKDAALSVHELSQNVLRLPATNATAGLEELQHELTCLLSTLRVSEAAGLIPKNIGALLYEQIDLVQRYIANHFFLPRSQGIETAVEQLLQEKQSSRRFSDSSYLKSSTAGSVTRKKPVRIPQGDISSDAYFVYSKLTDRAERIKTVLEAKPQATIKDIAEIITDVSEKTIQRELNGLIEKGQVRREGERRWSKYSVNK